MTAYLEVMPMRAVFAVLAFTVPCLADDETRERNLAAFKKIYERVSAENLKSQEPIRKEIARCEKDYKILPPDFTGTRKQDPNGPLIFTSEKSRKDVIADHKEKLKKLTDYQKAIEKEPELVLCDWWHSLNSSMGVSSIGVISPTRHAKMISKTDKTTTFEIKPTAPQLAFGDVKLLDCTITVDEVIKGDVGKSAKFPGVFEVTAIKFVGEQCVMDVRRFDYKADEIVTKK